jgi:tetraacyldisaccharide 4'-kinase
MLLRPSHFQELISGRRRGVGATVLRGILRLGESGYAAAVRWRNGRFDRGRARVHRAGVPVVSVGNLSLGGTGKTPLVAWLVRWFQSRGVSVGIVSRGYGADRGRLNGGARGPGPPGGTGKPRPEGSGGSNDEALELEGLLPGTPHVQNPDRLSAAREAVERFGCRLIVLDDGFQHRRIARDLDIVLLDALEPFGFDHLFPRGLLREPVEGLRRADVVALSRADLVDLPRRKEIWRTVRHHAPGVLELEGAHAPRGLVSPAGQRAAIETLRGQSVAAFCGIGNPAAFRRTLESCGCRIAGLREFPDHHRYTAADFDRLAAWADSLHAAALLSTGKDLVKVPAGALGKHPCWALEIGWEFRAGQEQLESRLAALLGGGT